MKLYLKNILISIDQLLNTILGGWCDETLSSRAFRTNAWYRTPIDLMFFWQYRLQIKSDWTGVKIIFNHCEQCYWWERDRRDLPLEFRNKPF